MGIETSEKLQAQHNRLTCNICGRKFEKIQALNTHLKFGHKINNRPSTVTSKLKTPAKFEVKAVKLVKKKVINSKHSKRPRLNMSPPKLRTNIAPNVNEVTLQNKMIAARKKTVFKCPKCIKIFGVYFSAYKHIQKYHCVDANDQPVEQNSSLLIKPIRIEPCNVCNSPQTEMHICTKAPEDNAKPTMQNNVAGLSMCLGCQKTFDNLEQFDDHVKKFHANNIESFFFPYHTDFVIWKTALETSTKTKFAMRITEKKPIQIYHCTHQPSIEMNKTLMCPSFLRVSEFKNGYQVFYYKDHYGHTCSPLSLTKYKKYSISSFLNEFDIKNLDSNKNIYQQFKSIMNNITNNAENVDNSVLNALLGKALEMTILVNSVVHDDDGEQMVKKNMTDYEISEALADVKTYPAKRKMDSVNKDVKKNNSESENNEDSKGNSSSNISVSENESSPRTIKPRALIQSPQSFNDTYKDFVDQTINKHQHDNPGSVKKSTVKKKVVMKTKIGQFKPNISPKGSTMVSSPRSSPKKELSLPKSTNIKGPRPAILSKSSGKTRLSPHTVKRPLTPNMSKKTSPAKKSKQNELKITKFTIKPDIKYEVKEQENDCNILILKI